MAWLHVAGRIGALCAMAGAVSLAYAQSATDDSGYRSTQTFRTFQAWPGEEEDKPVILGLPTVEVSDLYMPLDGSFLRASTYGRGVWDLQLR